MIKWNKKRKKDKVEQEKWNKKRKKDKMGQEKKKKIKLGKKRKR